jgi:lysophospholipase L1-like esterase
MGMAAQIKAAGGTPVLITPLSRRNFRGGKFFDSLAQWRTATIDAAKAGGYAYIDLNAESSRYITAIGESAASQYSPAAIDTTHLNAKGGVVFGRMVADLLVKRFPEVSEYIKPDIALSTTLKAGKPA